MDTSTGRTGIITSSARDDRPRGVSSGWPIGDARGGPPGRRATIPSTRGWHGAGARRPGSLSVADAKRGSVGLNRR